jgi:hypothetical protein
MGYVYIYIYLQVSTEINQTKTAKFLIKIMGPFVCIELNFCTHPFPLSSSSYAALQ